MKAKELLERLQNDWVGHGEAHLLSDFEKVVLILDALAKAIDKKADEDHKHTLI